jgi:hypothetical protein
MRAPAPNSMKGDNCCKSFALCPRHRAIRTRNLLTDIVFPVRNRRPENCTTRRDSTGVLTPLRRDCSPEHGGMTYKETFWMACDSTEQLRAEYGPFHTRLEAEVEARKLGFSYLLRYEHLLDENEEIQEVRCIFIELSRQHVSEPSGVSLHTRCATCGESSSHEKTWQAEVWADIHEFEHARHHVRLFEHARGKGLKEIAGWRRSFPAA